MNWLSGILNNINMDLQQLELDKANAETNRIRALRDPKRSLFVGMFKDSKIWSMTYREKETVETMRESLAGYAPQRTIQKQVLRFLEPSNITKNNGFRKFKIVCEISDNCTKGVGEYVKHSAYWKMQNIELDNPKNGEVTWTFARNDQMAAIICQYRGKMIVTTLSSHENIMRELEGKEPIFPEQWEKHTEPIDTILNLL